MLKNTPFHPLSEPEITSRAWLTSLPPPSNNLDYLVNRSTPNYQLQSSRVSSNPLTHRVCLTFSANHWDDSRVSCPGISGRASQCCNTVSVSADPSRTTCGPIPCSSTKGSTLMNNLAEFPPLWHKYGCRSLQPSPPPGPLRLRTSESRSGCFPRPHKSIYTNFDPTINTRCCLKIGVELDPLAFSGSSAISKLSVVIRSARNIQSSGKVWSSNSPYHVLQISCEPWDHQNGTDRYRCFERHKISQKS
jgi:hypothetical protein